MIWAQWVVLSCLVIIFHLYLDLGGRDDDGGDGEDGDASDADGNEGEEDNEGEDDGANCGDTVGPDGQSTAC